MDLKKETMLAEDRLKTFKKWPFASPNKCTKENMASAGFYFTGSKKEPDIATCFFCLKELDGWEEDDDPWEEHKKHASYCKFIQLNKNEEDITVKEMIELLAFRQCRRAEGIIDKKLRYFMDEMREKVENIEAVV